MMSRWWTPPTNMSLPDPKRWSKLDPISMGEGGHGNKVRTSEECCQKSCFSYAQSQIFKHTPSPSFFILSYQSNQQGMRIYSQKITQVPNIRTSIPLTLSKRELFWTLTEVLAWLNFPKTIQPCNEIYCPCNYSLSTILKILPRKLDNWAFCTRGSQSQKMSKYAPYHKSLTSKSSKFYPVLKILLFNMEQES